MSEDAKAKDAGPEEARRVYKDGDTEGHRKYADDGEEPAPDGVRKKVLRGDDEDVEGHKK